MVGFSHVVLPFGVALVAVLLGLGSEARSLGLEDKAQSHVGKGYDYEQNQRYEEAAQEFQTALALDPGLVRARYQLAVCYFALGKRKEAREEFERLRVTTSGDRSVIYYLGRLDLLEGNLDSAIRRFQSVVVSPPFPDTAYYLGSAYLKKDELEQAEHWLRKAADLDRRDFRVPDRLARLYQKQGRRQEAEREYARSAELRYHYNDAAEQAVNCTQKLETRPIEEARAACQRLFDSADPDKLTTLGMLYGQHGDYADALPPLVKAARLDPDSSEIQHNLGLTYFRLKRYREARAPLEEAVRLRPDFFGSNALLGATLYALKEDEAAYRILDQAHRLNPEDRDTAAILFKTALVLAGEKLASKQYPKCLRYLRKAAELCPDDAEVHRQLARVYGLLGRPAQADLESRETERLSAH